MTKMPLVNFGLTESQNRSKSVTRRFLSILTKFDLRLTLWSTKNSNFDPTSKIGWYQRHCKDYRIPFLMAIHGSKLELKRLRYLENCVRRVNLFPKAIMFDPTIIFSISLVFWKLDIQIFLGTLRLVQSEFGKAFKYAIEVRTEKLEEKDKTADVSSFVPTATKGPPPWPSTP